MGEIVAFAGDKSFVVASGIAMDHFFEAYARQEKWLRSFAFRRSGLIDFKDKHGKEHKLCCIESDRTVVIPAPPDLRISEKEVLQLAETIRAFQ